LVYLIENMEASIKNKLKNIFNVMDECNNCKNIVEKSEEIRIIEVDVGFNGLIEEEKVEEV